MDAVQPEPLGRTSAPGPCPLHRVRPDAHRHRRPRSARQLAGASDRMGWSLLAGAHRRVPRQHEGDLHARAPASRARNPRSGRGAALRSHSDAHGHPALRRCCGIRGRCRAFGCLGSARSSRARLDLGKRLSAVCSLPLRPRCRRSLSPLPPYVLARLIWRRQRVGEQPVQPPHPGPRRRLLSEGLPAGAADSSHGVAILGVVMMNALFLIGLTYRVMTKRFAVTWDTGTMAAVYVTAVVFAYVLGR